VEPLAYISIHNHRLSRYLGLVGFGDSASWLQRARLLAAVIATTQPDCSPEGKSSVPIVDWTR
jgi:hypothetical protein